MMIQSFTHAKAQSRKDKKAMTENEIAKIVADAAYHIYRRLKGRCRNQLFLIAFPGLRIDCRFSLRLCVRPFLFSPSRRLYEPEAGLSRLGIINI